MHFFHASPLFVFNFNSSFYSPSVNRFLLHYMYGWYGRGNVPSEENAPSKSILDLLKWKTHKEQPVYWPNVRQVNQFVYVEECRMLRRHNKKFLVMSAEIVASALMYDRVCSFTVWDTSLKSPCLCYVMYDSKENENL